MKHKVAAAISGGVDSMMAAHLLQSQGYDVSGIHFLTGFEPAGSPWASSHPGTHPVYRVGEQLGIPVTVVDCRQEFQSEVVAYFTQTYSRGLTPNPCVVCNPRIKFGVLLEHARRLGAGGLATGHYARIAKARDGTRRLFRGVDPRKDQSYFLARLTQGQLAKAFFPLGGLTKAQVKALAREKGFRPALRLESQDVCFVKAGGYADFLESRPGFTSEPGPIEDVHGNVLGEHRGLHRFTVGQRRGINCPAAAPFYVVRLDRAGNRLIVGSKRDAATRGCLIEDVSWIVSRPDSPRRVHVRLRYRHLAVAAVAAPEKDGDRVTVTFDAPQEAVTPGQAAVLYDEEEVLGGGFIERPLDEESGA